MKKKIIMALTVMSVGSAALFCVGMYKFSKKLLENENE